MFEQQKEIECELFEEYNKNIDRLSSLITFIFGIFGFYLLVFSNVYNKLNTEIFNNVPFIQIISLLACLGFSLVALIFPFIPLVMRLSEHKFKSVNGLVQFRSEEELEKHNGTLFSEVQLQNKYYIYSIMLIFSGLALFYGFFQPYAILLVFIVPLTFVIKKFSKIKTRKPIGTLETIRRQLETENNSLKNEIERLNHFLQTVPSPLEILQIQSRHEELEKHNETLIRELEKAERDKEDLKRTYNNYFLQVQTLINQKAIEAPAEIKVKN